MIRLSLALVLAILLASCSNEPPKDPLLLKAESGDPASQFAWAERLAGQGSPEALAWYEAAAKKGYLPAEFAIAIRNLDTSAELGIAQLDALAKLDHPESNARLGDIYREGRKVSANAYLSQKYYQRAADLGDQTARFRLAEAKFPDAYLIMPQDQQAAYLRELYSIAQDGEERAYSVIGRILDDEKKTEEADKAFFKAANAGDPYAMYRTGMAYHRYVRDPAWGPLGFDFLSKAAKAGQFEAVAALGKAYWQGNGVKADKDKGIDLLLVATLRGDDWGAELYTKALLASPTWTLDHGIDVIAIDRLRPDLPAAFLERYRISNPYQSDLARHYADKWMSALKQWADRFAAADFENPSKPSLDAFLAEQGADPELLRRALTVPNGDDALAIGKQLAAKGNLQDAQAWLFEASYRNSAEAALALYQTVADQPSVDPQLAARIDLALTNSASLGNSEAALLAAKLNLEGTFVPFNRYAAIRYGMQAGRAGLEKGFEYAEAAIKGEKFLDAKDKDWIAVIDRLADAGDLDARYARASREILESLDDYRSSIIPTDLILMDSYVDFSDTGRAKGSEFVAKERERWLENTQPSRLNEKGRNAVEEVLALASEGHTDARLAEALWRLTGAFGNKDTDAAIAKLKALSTEGVSPDAKFWYGYTIYRGLDGPSDLVAASILFHEAGEAGFAFARRYFSDLGPKSVNPANDRFEQAYRAGALNDPEAMFNVAMICLANTQEESEYRKSEYFKWLSKSAAANHIPALLEIAKNYIAGEQVDKNVLRGLRFMEKAADLGDAESQYALAHFLIFGKDIESDIPKAMRYLRLSADQDHLKAKQLVQSIQSTFPSKEMDSLTREELAALSYSAIQGQDYFPIVPCIPIGRELLTVSSVSKNRPQYLLNGATKSAAANAPAVFLAGERFHPVRIDITAITTTAPIVVTPNGIIYTGQEPSIKFDIQADAEIRDCYCLLIIKEPNQKFSHEWKSIGAIKPGKKQSVRFRLESKFSKAEDLSMFFFADGLEIASEIRVQPHHFLSKDLEKFTEHRNDYVKTHTSGDLPPSMFRPLIDLLYGAVVFPENAYAMITINESGFVSSIRLSDNVDDTLAARIFGILNELVFTPRLVEGVPTPAKVKLPLKY